MRAVANPVAGIALVTCLAAIAGSAFAAEPGVQARPSVLLVTLDTTRADHLGCYAGRGVATTPNLDALARAGTRFDQAISPAPLTLPSHASLLTGTVPRRHGVRSNALYRLGRSPGTLGEELRKQGYATAAFVSSVVLDRITGIDRGFEHYDDTVRVGAREAFGYAERAASQTNDAVFAQLDALEQPFFLWVHYFDPHLPYVPPAPFRERFGGRPYDGEIAFMDAQFGRLLAAVRRRAKSLVVVVAGDHGESLGEHGEHAHGVFIYQATQRVPLILAGPGVPRGKVVRERVGLVDVAPTLLDLLGAPALPDTDGRSIAPLLRDEPVGPRVYELESLFPFFSYGWAPLRALAGAEHKYIEAPRSELYRLRTDPDETRSVVAEENGIASEMAEDLRVLTTSDTIGQLTIDPELVEQRRRLEALGYVAGRAAREEDAVIDPKDGIAWIADLEAGRKAYQSGRAADGIEPVRRLLSRNPHNVPALLTLAQCYLGSGRAGEAVEADRRALEIRPDDDLVHFNLANALAARGRQRREALAEARAHYERALELNPRFADAYLNFAALLDRGGADAEALALLSRARSAGVRDPDLETRVAVLELKRGDVEAAKAAFRLALVLHPRAAGALEAMTRISLRQGHYREAAGYYERLLEVSPSAPGDPDRESLRELLEELSTAE